MPVFLWPRPNHARGATPRPLPQRTLATVPCFPTVGSLVTSVFARQRHPGRWEHHRYEAQCGLELVTPSDSFAPKPHKKYLEAGIAKCLLGLAMLPSKEGICKSFCFGGAASMQVSCHNASKNRG